MRRLTILVAMSVMMLLSGCNDDVAKDLAQCQIKAMELYKPKGAWSEWPAAAVHMFFSA
jgi:hypothetical protein